MRTSAFALHVLLVIGLGGCFGQTVPLTHSGEPERDPAGEAPPARSGPLGEKECPEGASTVDPMAQAVALHDAGDLEAALQRGLQVLGDLQSVGV